MVATPLSSPSPYDCRCQRPGSRWASSGLSLHPACARHLEGLGLLGQPQDGPLVPPGVRANANQRSAVAGNAGSQSTRRKCWLVAHESVRAHRRTGRRPCPGPCARTRFQLEDHVAPPDAIGEVEEFATSRDRVTPPGSPRTVHARLAPPPRTGRRCHDANIAGHVKPAPAALRRSGIPALRVQTRILVTPRRR